MSSTVSLETTQDDLDWIEEISDGILEFVASKARILGQGWLSGKTELTEHQ